MVEVAAQIRAAMMACLELRDGRYYATEAGCVRLRSILQDKGIPVDVMVGEDGRFEVHAL